MEQDLKGDLYSYDEGIEAIGYNKELYKMWMNVDNFELILIILKN